jgi:hypothetical protein
MCTITADPKEVRPVDKKAKKKVSDSTPIVAQAPDIF